MLALGLGLVFSEVCIPLTTRCLRAPLLYIGGESCDITPTTFVVWPPPCTRGNKARGVSVGNLIVKMAGSIQKRLVGRHVGDPLARGEDPRLSTELPDRKLGPCEGFLVRGSNED